MVKFLITIQNYGMSVISHLSLRSQNFLNPPPPVSPSQELLMKLAKKTPSILRSASSKRSYALSFGQTLLRRTSSSYANRRIKDFLDALSAEQGLLVTALALKQLDMHRRPCHEELSKGIRAMILKSCQIASQEINAQIMAQFEESLYDALCISTSCYFDFENFKLILHNKRLLRTTSSYEERLSLRNGQIRVINWEKVIIALMKITVTSSWSQDPRRLSEDEAIQIAHQSRLLILDKRFVPCLEEQFPSKQISRDTFCAVIASVLIMNGITPISPSRGIAPRPLCYKPKDNERQQSEPNAVLQEHKCYLSPVFQMSLTKNPKDALDLVPFALT